MFIFTDVLVYLVAIFFMVKIIFYPKGDKKLNSKREQKALESGYVNKGSGAMILGDKPKPYDPTITTGDINDTMGSSLSMSRASQDRVREFAKGLGMTTIAPGMIVGELAGRAIGNVAGKGARFVANKAAPHLRKIKGPALALGEKTFKAAKFYKTLAVEKGKHYANQVKDKAIGLIPEDTRRKIKFYTTLGVEKGKHYAIQAGRVIKSTQGYKLGERGLITMKGAVTADAYLTKSFTAPRGTAFRLKAANDIRQTASSNQGNLENKLKLKQNELAQFQQKIEEAKRIPNNENQIKLLQMDELKAKTETENIINQMKARDSKKGESKLNGPDYSKESERKSNLENERKQLMEALESERDPNGRKELEGDINRIDEELKKIQEENKQNGEKLDVGVNKLTVNMNPKLEILKAGAKEAREHGLTSKEAVMYSNLKKQMIEQEIRAEDSKTTFNRAEVQEYLVPAVKEMAKEKIAENVNSKDVYQTVERAIEQKHSEENMVRVAAKMHAEAKVDLEKEARKTLDDILSSDKAKEQLAKKIMSLDEIKDTINLTEETEGRVSELETLMKRAGKDIKTLTKDGIIKNGKVDDKKIEEITPLIKEEILKDPKSQLAREFLGEEGFKELSASLERNVEKYNTTVQKYMDNYERTQDELFIDRNIEAHPEYADLGPGELREQRLQDDRRRHIRNAMDEAYPNGVRPTNDNPIANSRPTRNYEPINSGDRFSQSTYRRRASQNRFRRYNTSNDSGITGTAV